MTQLKELLTKEDLKSVVRYFELLLRVFKRLKEEIKIDPTILDHLEPEFRLLLMKN